MSELSSGIQIDHTLASAEILASHHQCISPDHLFNGLAKLEDFQTSQALKDLGIAPQAVPLAVAEIEQLLNLFKQFQLDPQRARRAMRRLIGDGGYWRANEQEPISRTPES